MNFMNAQDFDMLAMAAQPNVLSMMTSSMPVMVIPSRNMAVPIDPPMADDRIQFDIEIYSENNPKMCACFEITREERIVVKLLAHGLSLPQAEATGG